MGGSVAVIAIVVLIGTLPFDNSVATARQNDLTSALNQRIEQLSSDVTRANGERDRLRVELGARVDERDSLAEQLARLEVMHVAELALMSEPISPEPEGGFVALTVTGSAATEDETAEDLLAELMRSAESEADAVTSVLAQNTPQVKATVYKVQPGDTLWKIANRHHMSVEALLEANNMSDANKFIVGQKIVVGGQPVSITTQPVVSKLADGDWYVVRPGDSLYGIGRKFESSVDDLLRWNQLANADSLQVGQRLRLFPIQ